MTPDKLPEMQQDKIKADAAKTYPLTDGNDLETGKRIGYIAGATAWAGWKVKHDEIKTILQEFVSNHEAGLLPDRFVYDKAIKILNDGK